MFFKNRVLFYLEEAKKDLSKDRLPTEKISKELINLEDEYADEWNKETKQEVRKLMKRLADENVRGSMKVMKDMMLKGRNVYDDNLVDEYLPRFLQKLKKEERKRSKR